MNRIIAIVFALMFVVIATSVYILRQAKNQFVKDYQKTRYNYCM